jgi:lambda family phage portal protein
MNVPARLPHPSLIDRLVGVVSPKAALNRLKFRAALSFYDDTTGYIVKGSSRRSMRGWNPGAKTADGDTLPKLEGARASSRDLYMNTPIASAALRRINTNVVGSGLTLQSRVDREFLGLSEEAADAWEKRTEREFRLWAESKECDITRTLNFAGLQRLAFLSTMMNGDCFVILPYIKNVNTQIPYQLKVQLIESDNVTNPNNRMDVDKTKAGIEFDEHEAPVAYWIRTKPYKMFATTDDWVRVPAFGEKSGRHNVLHMMVKERVGQKRGMPLLSPVIEACKQVTRLSEAELMGAVVSSMFTVFIKNTTGAGGLGPMFTEEESVLQEPDGSSGRDASTPDDNMIETGNGNIVELGEDQEIQTAAPNRPNDSFDPFYQSIVRQIGAAIEVPYEQLMLAFTASYSASRAALLEAWKYYRGQRTWLSANLCQPVYGEWLTEAIQRHRIRAPGYFQDPAVREAWRGAAWGGPGQGQIDPVKETKGAQLRIAAGLGNFEDEYTAIQGGDWEGNIQRRARQDRILERESVTVDLGIKAEPEPEEPEGSQSPAPGGKQNE